MGNPYQCIQPEENAHVVNLNFFSSSSSMRVINLANLLYFLTNYLVPCNFLHFISFRRHHDMAAAS
jgi:hypothetical protein